MRYGRSAAAGITVLTLVAPLSAGAQVPDAYVAVQGVYGSATGEFRDHVRHGGGVDLGFVIPLTANGVLGLRGAVGALTYGVGTAEECLSTGYGCRWHAVRVTHEMGWVGLGPQLAVGIGPLTPYASLLAGSTLFTADTRLSDIFEPGYAAFVNNHRSVTFSWSGGGGVLVNLTSAASGEHILLDAGVRYLHNGRSAYLTKGDVAGFPPDRGALRPVRSQANMLLIQLGLSVSLPY